MAKEEKIKEAEVIEEKAPKKEKDYKLRKVLRKTWDIIFWLAFVCIAALWIMDYVNTINEKDPKFCLSTNTVELENGSASECNGVGYKVLTYYNSNKEVTTREFGPFFIEVKK